MGTGSWGQPNPACSAVPTAIRMLVSHTRETDSVKIVMLYLCYIRIGAAMFVNLDVALKDLHAVCCFFFFGVLHFYFNFKQKNCQTGRS